MSRKIRALPNTILLIFIFIISTHIELVCQDREEDLISEFELNEGIYANYDEFKNNNPSKKYMPVVLSPGEVNKYLAEYTPQSIISSSGQYIWVGHFKTDGEFVRVSPDSIWGFCRGGNVVIKHGEFLISLNTVGSICHYGYKDALFADEIKLDNDQEFIFDFETGKVKRFKLDKFLTLLSKDMELYQEILRLDSYKKMRQAMFGFLLRFNERNPIHFPN